MRNRWVWLALALAGVGALVFAVLRPLRTEANEPPPPFLFQLPAFALVDHHAKPFGSGSARPQYANTSSSPSSVVP